MTNLAGQGSERRGRAEAARQNAPPTSHIAARAIFHCDRGCQDTASSTRDLLHQHGRLQTRSAAGYCDEHACAESAFASLKAELPNPHWPLPSTQPARRAIFDDIETFDNRRPRDTFLACISPGEDLKSNFTKHQKNLNQSELDLATFSGDYHRKLLLSPEET